MAETSELWFYIDGTSDVLSFAVSLNETISTLKRRIHNDVPNVPILALILTRVDMDLHEIDTAIHGGQRQLNTTNEPLRNVHSVSDVWPQGLPQGLLHVSVRVDPTVLLSESALRRQRLDNDPDSPFLEKKGSEVLHQFWKSLWQEKKNPFSEVPVHRDVNPVGGVDVPVTMKVLRLPDLFSSTGNVMVRGDYAEAVKALEGHSTSKSRGVVIVGHPGIGKTTLLYYILAKRLLKQQPTFLQTCSEFFFLFDARGVQAIPSYKILDSQSEVYQRAWALVDFNEDIDKPAHALRRENSPVFLIIASSPRASRWQNVHRYSGPIAPWFMQPFTLAELIQARQLQKVNCEESDIKNFFLKYGPSARDCYLSCSADDLTRYESTVRGKVHDMNWNSLTDLLTRRQGDIDMDQGSHRVLLVQPRLGTRADHITTIVTSTVSQLLWERDSDTKWQNHHNLLKTLIPFSCAKSFCGSLFEQAFHALCVRGTTFTLYPMTRREGRKNFIFSNTLPKSGPGSASLQLELDSQQQRFLFGEKHPITELLPKHYYQPIATNHPSYDSFVYDPVSRQISAFQATIGEKHDLGPAGVRALRDLLQRLGIVDFKIRIIVVGFEDGDVEYVVDKKTLIDLRLMNLKVYAAWVTDSQLYPPS